MNTTLTNISGNSIDSRQVDGTCTIYGQEAKYLIDTGDVQTFMRESVFEKFKLQVKMRTKCSQLELVNV